jgi:hypothetical protein
MTALIGEFGNSARRGIRPSGFGEISNFKLFDDIIVNDDEGEGTQGNDRFWT